MSKILKYKKIIMLSLILVAVIICVCATYITEWRKNKIDVETLFTTIEEDRTFKDNDEFLENYEYFYIYLLEGKDAYMNDNDSLVSGTKKFKVVSKDSEDMDIKNVSIQIKLAANWIGFQSNDASTNKYTSSNETTLTISNITQIFPAKGKLLFTNVKQPTLYVLIKWSDNSGDRYYTYLEMEYKEYNVTPVIPAEPTPEQPTQNQ